MRKETVLALGILLSLLGGCAAQTERFRLAPPPPGSEYVAMGSSFAAGAGIGPTKPNTPPRCQRTEINYATLLADRLGLSLVDATCGGATTAHLLRAWNELPPQINALTAETRLVTITVGGNDVGYVGGLMGASCRAGVPMGGRACPQRKLPGENDYRKLEGDLREFAREVAARSPKARLIFVQYVTLVSPTPCAATPLLPEDAAAARTIGLRLAETTARAARDAGALVLPADALSQDHTSCDAEPWSKAMSPALGGGPGAPWHPNAAGHAAIAAALAEWFSVSRRGD